MIYYFEDISKEQSIDIIEAFFNNYLDEKKKKPKIDSNFNVLQTKKSEHILKAETIKYIKKINKFIILMIQLQKQ